LLAVDTVFVLGAGASKPFGFPTGAELRTRLCTELVLGHGLYLLLLKCGHSQQEVENFRLAFERSAINSIDAFIALRPTFQTIAEQAIAAVLMPLENETTLNKGDWYQIVWNEMLAGVSTTEELLLNTIRFITFNYDRSLEQYLLGAIQHTFDLEPEAAYQCLSRIPIHHVYGSLGAYTSGIGFQYHERKDEDIKLAILNAQKSIKTIPSVRGPLDVTAAEWLSHAEHVFILGFGFDAVNCARIDLPSACTKATPHNPPNIFASAFESTSSERRRCERSACAQGRGGLSWTLGDCLDLLRDRRDQLT